MSFFLNITFPTKPKINISLIFIFFLFGSIKLHSYTDARAQILKIHSRAMAYAKEGVHAVNFDEIARSTEDFNGAMLKAVCVEAGMLALRNERTSLTHEDYNEGVSVVQSKKKVALQYYA